MEIEAINRASVELDHARLRLDEFRTAHRAKNRAVTKCAWVDLLAAWDRVYKRLGAGVKQSGPEKGWFDKIRHQRKSDPLLSYVYQARNTNEHGLSETVDVKEGTPFLGAQINGILIGMAPTRGGIMMVDVINYGVTYPVPKIHLDQPIVPPNNNPISYRAELVIKYLEKMIEDAKAYC